MLTSLIINNLNAIRVAKKFVRFSLSKYFCLQKIQNISYIHIKIFLKTKL